MREFSCKRTPIGYNIMCFREKKIKGITLLEIVIVIIIVGVLASLAIPAMFESIEFSKRAEAFAGFSTIRRAVNHALLLNENYFVIFANGLTGLGEKAPGFVDPGLSPGALFDYAFINAGTYWFIMEAHRKDNPSNFIWMFYTKCRGVEYFGEGVYEPLGKFPGLPALACPPSP